MIRCGEYDLSTNDTIEAFPHQERDVEDFTIHPFYTGSNKKQDGSFGNDIAIIHTKTSFKQAPNVNTICLPTPDLPYSESICSSMGWGTNTLENKNSRQDIMKQVKLNRITNSECEVESEQLWNFILLWMYFMVDFYSNKPKQRMTT